MKCLAIDDEPLALAQLSDYISRVPFLSLVKPCLDAFEAMKVLSDEDVDLIFIPNMRWTAASWMRWIIC